MDRNIETNLDNLASMSLNGFRHLDVEHLPQAPECILKNYNETGRLNLRIFKLPFLEKKIMAPCESKGGKFRKSKFRNRKVI